jgi:hypothetical protein
VDNKVPGLPKYRYEREVATSLAQDSRDAGGFQGSGSVRHG